MALREEIKSILKKYQVGARYIETAVDEVVNTIVRVQSTDLVLPPAPSDNELLNKVSSLEKELATVNERTSKLEVCWGQVQNAFALTVSTTIAPQPTMDSEPAKSSEDDFITDEELEFFRNECSIVKDDSLKIVTSVHSKSLPNPYKPDGSSFRIVVLKGGKQKRFNNKKLYTALYENSFPQV